MSPIGKYLQVDHATPNRERSMFAIVLVEVKMYQSFPDTLCFRNERKEMVEQKVFSTWKPVQCKKCNEYGHLGTDCVKKHRE